MHCMNLSKTKVKEMIVPRYRPSTSSLGMSNLHTAGRSRLSVSTRISFAAILLHILCSYIANLLPLWIALLHHLFLLLLFASCSNQSPARQQGNLAHEPLLLQPLVAMLILPHPSIGGTRSVQATCLPRKSWPLQRQPSLTVKSACFLVC
jgi:hypothetical protein